MSPVYLNAIITLWLTGKLKDYEVSMFDGCSYFSDENPASYTVVYNIKNAYRQVTGREL